MPRAAAVGRARGREPAGTAAFSMNLALPGPLAPAPADLEAGAAAARGTKTPPRARWSCLADGPGVPGRAALAAVQAAPRDATGPGRGRAPGGSRGWPAARFPHRRRMASGAGHE